MPRVKRTHYVLFHLSDSQQIDLGQLLRGVVAAIPGPPDVYALAILTGKRERLSRAELDAVLSVPAERWIDAAELAPVDARSLAARGLLVSDDDDKLIAELRGRDARLTASQWNVYAAAYHFMTQWEGVDVRDTLESGEWTPVARATADAFIELHGPSPPPFHSPAPGAPVVPLPAPKRDDGLYAALHARRTTRAFATGDAMRREHLAAILYYVFGAHGSAEGKLGTAIKRTSPSGGARHSVEAYPLIADVEGIDSGIYHYDVRSHGLTLLRTTDPSVVRSLATSFMCGQSYFGAAHVGFVLTVRFARTNWKYRRADKAYATVLMDAAHLSQTLYLVAAELGLGAFVTVALNSRDIERHLDLDGCAEGVIAMAGCGPRAPDASPLDLKFTPR
jgi:putative peptide maturation dehydrogenase